MTGFNAKHCPMTLGNMRENGVTRSPYVEEQTRPKSYVRKYRKYISQRTNTPASINIQYWPVNPKIVKSRVNKFRKSSMPSNI
jgi:hypothetical protein